MEELGRPLRFTADWGMANFYRIFGWVAHNLYARLGRSGLSSIDTSQAWVDAIEALATGTTDVTIATPTEFAVQAREGLGQFDGRPHPEIRALALLPHDDAVLIAVADESPINDLGDILRLELPVRFALPPDDGACHAGWACRVILDEYGLSREVVEGLGGSMAYREFPRFAPSLLLAGHADVVLNEAMMLPDWKDLAERRPTRFLSVDEGVLRRLTDKYKMRSRSVHAGRLPGQTEALRTVDFSGWLVVTTEDLPEEVAYTLTSVMVETRGDLERLYNGALSDTSPLTGPVRADHMPLTGDVPLHPGAERYYRERGLFERWT